jgi:hypothetical protein
VPRQYRPQVTAPAATAAGTWLCMYICNSVHLHSGS